MNTILRLTPTCSQKIYGAKLPSHPLTKNPFLDWHAHMFTNQGAHIILTVNTHSFLTVAINASDVYNIKEYRGRMEFMFRELLGELEAGDIFEKILLPNLGKIKIGKAENKKMVNMLNELVQSAKKILEFENMSPYELSVKLNERMITFKGKQMNPNEAFVSMDPKEAPEQPKEHKPVKKKKKPMPKKFKKKKKFVKPRGDNNGKSNGNGNGEKGGES